MSDPWTDRLSEYLDGDLAPAERRELWRHLADCDVCPAVLEDLRAVLAEARALPEREPERDLWPAIAERIGLAAGPASAGSPPTPVSPVSISGDVHPGARPWLVALVAAAAGVLATLGALRVAGRGPAPAPGSEVATGGSARWLLLLREPQDMMADATPEEVAAVVERYAHWARGVAEEGHLEAGEKLAEDRGWMLAPGREPRAFAPLAETTGAPERVSGFFLIRAHDAAEAERIAADCPHLAQGGWVELRRIEEL